MDDEEYLDFEGPVDGGDYAEEGYTGEEVLQDEDEYQQHEQQHGGDADDLAELDYGEEADYGQQEGEDGGLDTLGDHGNDGSWCRAGGRWSLLSGRWAAPGEGGGAGRRA